jgi:hypothetical protein
MKRAVPDRIAPGDSYEVIIRKISDFLLYWYRHSVVGFKNIEENEKDDEYGEGYWAGSETSYAHVASFLLPLQEANKLVPKLSEGARREIRKER